jgi:hypothetical protein
VESSDVTPRAAKGKQPISDPPSLSLPYGPAETHPDRAAVVALADPALRVIVESWDRLSPSARDAVAGMVRALLKEGPKPRKLRKQAR